MSLIRRTVARALPAPALSVAVHRDLYMPAQLRRDHRPIALVFGNCQAEALRRVLVTHPGFAERYQLLRIPAVHEISAKELELIEARLPEVEVFIAQNVKPGYRGMALGTTELAQKLPSTARTLGYPVAYFEGPFPFHVYVNREGTAINASAPITEYHDLRHLYAASKGWNATTTLRKLDELVLDPDWVRSNAERSLGELAKRESELTARLTPIIAEHPTTSFRTLNHPVNGLVTQVARQLLTQLGYADADRVLDSRQFYLDHTSAPLEPQIVRALGGEPDADTRGEWITPEGTFSRSDVVTAHLAFYADEPGLVEIGVRKHAERLRVLESMWR
ncbi:WcbI family polysaccharide biosynthesis putative acetyltransferase [Kineosporia succinea]|uniref:Polysaccharide biosynthesis enzyme WcbI domain-containing protein n=1 Tax=Kineosporia succinea TaxID=84632 RepID=A0ABT9NZV7_9ACTN|nr:WcbI family polysaccharide biosynthesis putative acetyltransferase [Kineosporia succinea]MDP9825964.1 hypothetical protein [Kineosporia succinea]